MQIQERSGAGQYGVPVLRTPICYVVVRTGESHPGYSTEKLSRVGVLPQGPRMLTEVQKQKDRMLEI